LLQPKDRLLSSDRAKFNAALFVAFLDLPPIRAISIKVHL